MSAWMVSNETLSKIANELSVSGARYFMNRPATEIFNELAEMNINALRARYQDRCDDMIGDVYYIDNIGREPNQYQLLKSLYCYKYQCSESSVPSSKTYAEIDKFIMHIAFNIISDMYEYKKAEWR